jgi:CRP-like cAMP-binding protein
VIENSILAALPRSDYRRILPSLKHVDLTLGEILYENNAAIKHVYFPDRSVVSLIWGNRDKLSIEVGLVGSEGMVGICLISGVKSVPYSTVVRRADSAMRMDAGAFKAEFARGGALQKLLLSYIHGLFVQVSRTAICNRIHPLQERFCRCLLMIQDRAKSCELILTHEFIANMLGARRSDVTIAAGILQRAGLIRYSRGHITILDRNGLEAASCNCYQISKEEFNRIGLGW